MYVYIYIDQANFVQKRGYVSQGMHEVQSAILDRESNTELLRYFFNTHTLQVCLHIY